MWVINDQNASLLNGIESLEVFHGIFLFPFLQEICCKQRSIDVGPLQICKVNTILLPIWCVTIMLLCCCVLYAAGSEDARKNAWCFWRAEPLKHFNKICCRCCWKMLLHPNQNVLKRNSAINNISMGKFSEFLGSIYKQRRS